MCLQCHQSIKDENFVLQLQEVLVNPQFEKWNTTSLNHLMLAAKGLNGEEAHHLAVRILDNFYKWFLGSSNGLWEKITGPYIPSSGLEPFPKIKILKKQIDEANIFYEQYKHLHKEEILELLQNQ